MERDDRFATLLLDHVPPLSGLEVAAGRAAIARRVTAARRRQRLVRGAAAVGVAAALVGVTVLLWPSPSQTRLPTIAPEPPPTAPIDEEAAPDGGDAPQPSADGDPCVPARGGGADPALLDELAEGRSSIVDGGCVLPGRLGPTPRFYTPALGAEQPVDLDVPAGTEPIPTVDDLWDVGLRGELLPRTPAIHVGGGEFLTWRTDPSTLLPVVCVTGHCLSPTELAGVSGPMSVAGSAREFVVTVWVPAEAAAVALALDGEPVSWTRPVARTARLSGEATRDPTTQVMQRPQSITVTIYDAEGRILAEDTDDFPLQ
jgi:hypothetical protein